jgi:crotonobetainyl-CoA:carnitine CoA-transferase CaiB-like acyl-CoA transferase
MTGVLAGVRVLQLAGIGPVPFCGMHLADLGADVIVVDSPASAGAVHQAADLINRGKRSVMLDLKTTDGVASALRIGARCDILIEGMRPGVAERLGLGPEDFRKVNPALVYGRMTGWGQGGPLAPSAGHDLNYLALSGAAWFAGNPGEPPVPPPTLVGDLGGGALYLTIGVLSALLHARASGVGQTVDAAIVDGAAHLTSLLLSLRASGELGDQRGKDWIDGSPWYRCYRTADGHFVSVGALEAKFFAALMKALGLDTEFPARSQFDKSQWPTMRARLEAIFAGASRETWIQRFEGVDACFAPVLDPAEAAVHPHNVHRGIYRQDRGFLEAAPAPRFSGFPLRATTAAACRPGQHTEEVLRELGS